MDKKIFISYSKEDANVVHKIAEKLKETLSIWIDVFDLQSGIDLKKQVVNAIKNSSLMLCFISGSYCASDSCYKEFTFAENLNKLMLPVMLEKEASDEIEFSIATISKFNAFITPNTFHPWTQESDALCEKLKNHVINLIQSNMQPSVNTKKKN